jgi:broad specificity phosphatase PhoE
MKNIFLIYLVAMAGFATLASGALAQPALYLVRHAEKLPNWPGGALDAFHPLSAEGIARAQRLAGQFEAGRVAAIFSSPTTRTIHTALPLSQKLGLQIQTAAACMDTAAIDSFYAGLAKRFGPDKAVVLVSHSNIIPYLLIKAGLPASCRKELGITGPDEDGWLLIEGYGNIWRVDQLGVNGKRCERIARIGF